MKKEKLIITAVIIVVAVLTILYIVLPINKSNNDFKIVDETGVCATALETIYEDEHYRYNLGCLSSSTVFVVFNNGEKITMKKALNEKKITLADLIKKNYTLYYEPKYILNLSPSEEVTEVILKDYKVYIYKQDILYNKIKLADALKDNKITIEDLLTYKNYLVRVKSGNINETNGNIKYSSLEYSIIKCNNGNYYIGANHMLDTDVCK